ncbi:hypothetical protein MMC25_004032 [Agyrium rufum]|nr:hypothetical protein [Agyrium rufum]
MPRTITKGVKRPQQPASPVLGSAKAVASASKGGGTFRRVFLTLSVFAITVTGAWYGAGLKWRQEVQQEMKARTEATATEKIAFLEGSRDVLVAKKLGLELKIMDMERKRLEREKRLEVMHSHR